MEIALPTAWRFDAFQKDVIDRLLPTKKEASAPEPKKDGGIICASCGLHITRKEARLIVDGTHQHRFSNPHGIVFDIGCYNEATGCAQVGEATEEHTWFTGHAWRIAVCSGCHVHLGWGFHARGGGRFFGLILNRLATL